jgi:hypothetical protein
MPKTSRANPRAWSRTRLRQTVCLTVYARCGSIAEAARAAGVHRSTINGWCRRDFRFWQRWVQARTRALETLYDTIIERAEAGDRRPVRSPGHATGMAALRKLLWHRRIVAEARTQQTPQRVRNRERRRALDEISRGAVRK